MRRGKPAIHISWGVDRALNAASWLYFQAARCIETAPATDALRLRLFGCYTAALRELHLGQAADIAWHREPAFFPSVEDYFAMTGRKTGTLAALAAELGLAAGGAPAALVAQGAAEARRIGVAFQVLDDVTSLTRGNPGKKRGDDIIEGKKSYPILLYAQAHGENTPLLLDCFRRASGGEEGAVEECIGLLSDAGTLEEAAEDARRFLSDAVAGFRGLFPKMNTEALAELFPTQE
jgi:octaprenyl-diphosphate synthase